MTDTKSAPTETKPTPTKAADPAPAKEAVPKNEPAPPPPKKSKQEEAHAKFTRLAKSLPNDTPDEFVMYGYGGVKITAKDMRDLFL